MHIKFNNLDFLACPLDDDSLTLKGMSLECEAGHSFDISKYSYVNLLPVQFKSSREPGDSKEMVKARSRIHKTGVFDKVSRMLNKHLEKQVDDEEDTLIIDAGCGDGYYLRQYFENVVNRDVKLLGIDISKWAVKEAAKQNSEATWIVGSNSHLPIKKGAASIILSVFGFETWKSWSAKQVSHQSVFVIKPCEKHLLELRELIYDEVRLKSPEADSKAFESGYALVSRNSMSYTASIKSLSELMSLLEMTPHSKKKNIRNDEPLANQFPFKITIAVVLFHYQKQ